MQAINTLQLLLGKVKLRGVVVCKGLAVHTEKGQAG
jgi:hypothetical protein